MDRVAHTRSLAKHVELQDSLGLLDRFVVRFLGIKLFIGYGALDGWAGKVPLYVFWCSRCSNYVKDSPRGFDHRQYLLCPCADTQGPEETTWSSH